MAYLGDNAGLDVLADAARNQYAFRIFALAAMASFDDPEVYVKLRDLLDVDSAETRYGAFRALTTLNANDPFVRGRTINDQFKLHVLATGGPPMVHLTNCKKTEVVLFGAKQELRRPLFARAGTCILVSAPAGSSEVRVCRFALGQEDQRKIVSTRLEDVILAMTDLGATFPDVAQFLTEANSQHNLAGRLEIDALPRAGRFYDRSRLPTGDDAASHGKKRVGSSNTAPNLFAIEIGKTSKDGDEDGERPRSSENDQAVTGRRKSRRGTTDDDFSFIREDVKSSHDRRGGRDGVSRRTTVGRFVLRGQNVGREVRVPGQNARRQAGQRQGADGNQCRADRRAGHSQPAAQPVQLLAILQFWHGRRVRKQGAVS